MGRWNEAEFENETGWRVIACEFNQRDVGILLKGCWASLVAWWGTCYYGVAVLVLDGSGGKRRGTLFVSAHLPDRGMET
eukprot:6949425-Karenia_brevis.AAC.1